MKLVLASRNVKKIAELKTMMLDFFPDVEILSLNDIGMTGEIEETGKTFEENALIKAKAAASGGYIGVGDDSGLAVDALNGAPGVYSARYAAVCNDAGGHDDEANNRLLLEKMKTVPEDARGAAFVCCVACVFPDGRSFTVRGEVRGSIMHGYRGKGGFGYDPLFWYAPFGKSFAELTPEEKNSVSHRGIAMKKFADQLKILL